MSGGVEFVFVPSPNRATQAERSGLEHVVPPLAPLLNMERPARRPRRLSDAEPGAAGAAGNPGARKTPRYSPGRRALSTRSVNQVWTIAPASKQTTGDADAAAPAPHPTPSISPGTLDARIERQFAPSPALHAMIAENIMHVMRTPVAPTPNVQPTPVQAPPSPVPTSAPPPQRIALGFVLPAEPKLELVLQESAGAATGDGVPVGATPLAWLSTPSPYASERCTPANLRAVQPTVSDSGGFAVSDCTKAEKRLSPTPRGRTGVGGVPPGATPLAWLALASPFATPKRQEERALRWTPLPAPPPRYGCTILAAREVCRQDPLNPVAFPTAFTLYAVEVAVVDAEQGGATLYKAEKRYSEFAALDEELREWMDAEHAGSSTGLWAPSLPPKRLWPGRDSVIAERKKGLQRYIDWIITLEATVPRQVLLQFLLPEGCAPRMESPRSQ